MKNQADKADHIKEN